MKYFLIGLIICFSLFSEDISLQEKESTIAALEKRLKPFLKLRWDKLLATHKKGLLAAETKKSFYRAITKMLNATKQSHTAITPPYLQNSSGGKAGYGLTVKLVEGTACITAVKKGSMAEKAGIKPGYIIQKINSFHVETYLKKLLRTNLKPHKKRSSLYYFFQNTLSQKEGAELKFVFKNRDDKIENISLRAVLPKGKAVKLGHLSESYLSFEKRKLTASTGYIAFNLFYVQHMKPIKKAFYDFHYLENIIIDLRGNPGGIGILAGTIATLFMGKKSNLGTSDMPEFKLTIPVWQNEHAFKGRVYVIIDESSGSTSEMFAGSLQELGRVSVIGRQSMGSVLTSYIVKLPDGSRLQYPVGDYKTPGGKSLEGIGVIPNDVLKLKRRDFIKHDDPILARCLEIIKKGKVK
ncbi:MAG: hypothetical protein HRT89_15760 [Lentisphaeria bacterium]|nr:S41 family peptidase [Lentisphaeria bacterium]NQZ69514.1 hypothetical protein [Lentisphaeria bacterium]